MPLTFSRRNAVSASVSALSSAGIPPLLARIYAARGVTSAEQLATEVTGLAPLARMHNIEHMAVILADAIAARQRLLIVADYDSDGATACAVGMRALREFGAVVDLSLIHI